MEPIAFGFMAMTAEQFDAVTPRELQWRYAAEVERENRQFDRLAQLACWVINPWMGQHSKPLTVRSLLRRGPAKKSVDWWDE